MLHQPQKLVTNSKDSRIITTIKTQLEDCDEFIISVAFITLSGVTCILEALQQLELRNIKGKILTGCYLNFTEPKALSRLLEFKNIELKVLTNEKFHAKGFFFRKNDDWQIMIGSSNLTQSALTVNNEWNILFHTNSNQQVYRQLITEFTKLFDEAIACKDIIEQYRLNYHKAKTTTTLELPNSHQTIVPNKLQQQILHNLDILRDEGESKALVISATGTGKTFVSAFDVAKVRPKKCLFIVHRANIAVKASESFAKVITEKSIGLYTGNNKSSADYLFGTVQTLKNPQVLAKFKRDAFDYIIIDEVHHAEAESYKKILAHFTPKFLLGMTATPERSDGADIFKLFDHNIAHEVRLHQALAEDLLCPFHYFAIEDFYLEAKKTLAKDFSKMDNHKRIDHLITKMDFYGYSGEKRTGLMFVSNIDEAIAIAKLLNQRGVKAKALTSQDPEHIRKLAIQELEAKRLEILVTVDIFNEGVDIPCLNQIILLRPTQSAIVYIQQLGRGLRKHRDKNFVVILDFIANYENNFLIPIALSGNNSYDKDELKKFVVAPNNFIGGKSTITFTSVAKEVIYNNIQKTNFSQLKNIKKDYIQLKKKLGKIPLLTDFEINNFISPTIILNTKNTYYDILRAFKEDVDLLDSAEYQTLKFLSKEFTPAKRLYEILILDKLLSTPFVSIVDLKTFLKKYLTTFSLASFCNALEHLALQIFKVNAGRAEYQPLIKFDNHSVTLLINKMLNNNRFLLLQVKDLLAYNKIIYTKKYAQYKIQDIALYQKYSKKDIAHLLNQDYSNGGVNLAGYRVIDDKALLFMTFDESKKFTQFDNKFIDNSTFTYFSKKNKSLTNPLEKALFTNQYTSFVFARINKTNDYYFLGLINECIEAIELSKPDIMVKYTFQLQQKLPKELWQYFKNIYKNKNNLFK